MIRRCRRIDNRRPSGERCATIRPPREYVTTPLCIISVQRTTVVVTVRPDREPSRRYRSLLRLGKSSQCFLYFRRPASRSAVVTRLGFPSRRPPKRYVQRARSSFRSHSASARRVWSLKKKKKQTIILTNRITRTGRFPGFRRQPPRRRRRRYADDCRHERSKCALQPFGTVIFGAWCISAVSRL